MDNSHLIKLEGLVGYNDFKYFYDTIENEYVLKDAKDQTAHVYKQLADNLWNLLTPSDKETIKFAKSQQAQHTWLNKDPKNSWLNESTTSIESKHEVPGLDDDLQALDMLNDNKFHYFIDKSNGGFLIYNTKTAQEEYVPTLKPELMKKLQKSGLLSGLPNPVITSLKNSENTIAQPKKTLSFTSKNKGTRRPSQNSDSLLDPNKPSWLNETKDKHRPELFRSQKSDSLLDPNKPSWLNEYIDTRDADILQSQKSDSLLDPQNPSWLDENNDTRDPDILQSHTSNVLQNPNNSTLKNAKNNNSTDEPKWCKKFTAIFFVTFFLMVIVWIFNLGYSYGKYFTQLKTLSPRLVQFYYIYSAICMFVAIVLMLGTLGALGSHWYLIFALFGIGHIVTSTVVLCIVVPKMDKDPSLKELKNNVRGHLGIDIINGILMVIGALGTHYCMYHCTLKAEYLVER